MKKRLMGVILVILVLLTTMPVMATEEKRVFEQDVSVWKEGTISVYSSHDHPLYHVLEHTSETDFYSVLLGKEFFRLPGTIYEDCSSSMDKTFSYEKSIILENLSPYLKQNERKREKVFTNQKTDLYGLLSSCGELEQGIIIADDETPIIITDLWDTKGEEDENFRYWGDIVFCVPYESTNKEGVLHCEEVVNNLLWHHSMAALMHVYVIYMDEVAVGYGNGFHKLDEGTIEIYIP